MKYYIFILVLFTVLITSCDGRDRALESNTERLSRSNLSNIATEVIKFVPENYLKRVTDTLIDTNTNVKVSYYSSSNESVIVSNKNNPNIKTHYREFESRIEVFKNDKLLFTNIINKNGFITNEQDFWKSAVLQYVWLDDFESTNNNYKLYCSFQIPETENYKMYSILFDNTGKRTIKLIETS